MVAADEKAKKFEKVKTPILVSLEQKKKEERAKKLKEKISQGANQVNYIVNMQPFYQE